MVEHTIHHIDGEKNKIKVIASNPFTAAQEMTFNCSMEQYLKAYREYQENPKLMVQDVFTFLNNDEREFLISGFTPEMWTGLKKEV